MPDESILHILRGFESEHDLYIHPDIPHKKLYNARMSCGIEPDHEVLALINCTTLGSAKDCLVFCPEAVYFHNNPALARPEAGRIEYATFANRTFTAHKSYVHLDFNQIVHVANSSLSAETVLSLLTEIRASLTPEEEKPSDSDSRPARGEARTAVFPPINVVKFPPYCIGCLADEPDRELTMATPHRRKTDRFGMWLGGAVGATLMKMQMEKKGKVLEYEIPICESCLDTIRNNDIKMLKDTGMLQSMLTPTEFFSREFRKGYVVMHFRNARYAREFWRINEDFVFTTIEEADGVIEGDEGSEEEGERREVGIPLSREELLERMPPHCPEMKWYVQPNIPAKKLVKALNAHGLELEQGKVLALGDATTFGSAKSGCLITMRGVHFKNPSLGEKGYIPFEGIERCEPVGGFPTHKIRIWTKDGSKETIECEEFKGVRGQLCDFLNWVGGVAQALVHGSWSATS